jgi:hypothetical protein
MPRSAPRRPLAARRERAVNHIHSNSFNQAAARPAVAVLGFFIGAASSRHLPRCDAGGQRDATCVVAGPRTSRAVSRGIAPIRDRAGSRRAVTYARPDCGSDPEPVRHHHDRATAVPRVRRRRLRFRVGRQSQGEGEAQARPGAASPDTGPGDADRDPRPARHGGASPQDALQPKGLRARAGAGSGVAAADPAAARFHHRAADHAAASGSPRGGRRTTSTRRSS